MFRAGGDTFKMKRIITDISGKDNHEAWANLLGAVTQACTAKQENGSEWPMMVSSSVHGKITAVDEPEFGSVDYSKRPKDSKGHECSLQCPVCDQVTHIMRLVQYTENGKWRWGYLCPKCAERVQPTRAIKLETIDKVA